MFYGRKCLIATKHGKEAAIGLPLKAILGLDAVAKEIDTDQLGTFSQEIERKLTPILCAQKKCLIALNQEPNHPKISCAIASEGSFGPHPQIPLLPCNHEILYFIDKEQDLHLHVSELFCETNLAKGVFEELDSFLLVAKTWRFPSHGLILRPNIWKRGSLLYKGVNSLDFLKEAFEKSKSASMDGRVWVETDMRAHQNPTRMGCIAILAEKMSQRLALFCPKCNSPGWGVVRESGFLPCHLCGEKTDLPNSLVYGCCKCIYTESRQKEGQLHADPQFCPFCNP